VTASSALRASVVVAAYVTVALLAATPACAPRNDLEGRPCPCAEGYRCCDPAGICVANASVCAGGAITSADTVARICAEPHGPALGAPRTAAAFTRFLARRWFGCHVNPAAPPTAIDAHEGIEFADDETWTFLRSTTAGYVRSTDPTDRGTYQIWNDRLSQLVKPTDTTPGHDLHVRFVHGAFVLNLFFEFEHGPLRFQTVNGAVLFYVGEGADESGDGSDLLGSEGTACESDHAICAPGKKCVSVVSAELCEQPAANLAAGEGCDPNGVRTCAPPLVCNGATKQCAATP
jgi:hypothetical protein